jgi:hypothetical protein
MSGLALVRGGGKHVPRQRRKRCVSYGEGRSSRNGRRISRWIFHHSEDGTRPGEGGSVDDLLGWEGLGEVSKVREDWVISCPEGAKGDQASDKPGRPQTSIGGRQRGWGKGQGHKGGEGPGRVEVSGHSVDWKNWPVVSQFWVWLHTHLPGFFRRWRAGHSPQKTTWYARPIPHAARPPWLGNLGHRLIAQGGVIRGGIGLRQARQAA